MQKPPNVQQQPPNMQQQLNMQQQPNMQQPNLQQQQSMQPMTPAMMQHMLQMQMQQMQQMKGMNPQMMQQMQMQMAQQMVRVQALQAMQAKAGGGGQLNVGGPGSDGPPGMAGIGRQGSFQGADVINRSSSQNSAGLPSSNAQQQQMQQMQNMQNMINKQQEVEAPAVGTGFSARIDTIIMHENMYADSKMIVRALFLFGCSPSKTAKHKFIGTIMDNFKKQKVNDNIILTGMVPLMAPQTIQLFKKLIQDEGIRTKFISWIRYDIYQMTCHSTANGLDYVPAQLKDTSTDDLLINLNICGTKYSALRSILLRTGSSYFKKLCKAKPGKWHLDENKAYFIDRDGEIFNVVLRYLRSNEVRFDAKKYTVAEMQTEFKFYDVSWPTSLLKNLPNMFRFEYCCMYNQTGQFFANKFRVLPKKNVPKAIAKYINIPKGEMRDPQLFFALKDEIKKLGFQLYDTHKFRGAQAIWTYVEVYHRNIWSPSIRDAVKAKSKK